MPTIKWDEFRQEYGAKLPSGEWLWCDSAHTLADVLYRIDDRQAKRDDAYSVCVAIFLGAVLLVVWAAVSQYL